MVGRSGSRDRRDQALTAEHGGFDLAKAPFQNIEVGGTPFEQTAGITVCRSAGPVQEGSHCAVDGLIGLAA